MRYPLTTLFGGLTIFCTLIVLCEIISPGVAFKSAYGLEMFIGGGLIIGVLETEMFYMMEQRQIKEGA